MANSLAYLMVTGQITTVKSRKRPGKVVQDETLELNSESSSWEDGLSALARLSKTFERRVLA